MVEDNATERDELSWCKFRGENTILQFGKLVSHMRPELESAIKGLDTLHAF